MEVALPATPYVPGVTPRPAEDAYDALKDVSEPLRHCRAWVAGRRFFDAACFWEAHEVWEAVWMAAPENSAEKQFVQGMIQLANAGLKRKMGRENAALRLEALAEGLLSEALIRDSDSHWLSPEDLEAARLQIAKVNDAL